MPRLLLYICLLKYVCALLSPSAAPSRLSFSLSAGVYCLYLQNDCYYVGKTTRDISERVLEHFREDKLQWLRRNSPIQRIDTMTSLPQDLDSWERSETIDRMKIHGATRVRGWRYTTLTLSARDREDIVRDITERNDLCRGCGESGHFYLACKNRATGRVAEWTTAIFEEKYVPPVYLVPDSVNTRKAPVRERDLYSSTKATTSVIEQQSRDGRRSSVGSKGNRAPPNPNLNPSPSTSLLRNRPSSGAGRLLDAARESVPTALGLNFVMSYAAARALGGGGSVGPRLLVITALVDAQIALGHQALRRRFPKLLLPEALAATAAALLVALACIHVAPARIGVVRSALYCLARLLIALLYRNAVCSGRGKYESSRLGAMHTAAGLGGAMGVLAGL